METYLIHHGILGQRWGIRRYQNKDGSLTPKGKKRLEKIEKKLKGVNEKIDADYQKKGEKIAGKLLKTQKKVPFTVDEQLKIAKQLGVSDKEIDKLAKQAKNLQTNNHLQNIQTQQQMQMFAQQEQIQRQMNAEFQHHVNIAVQNHMQFTNNMLMHM